MTTKENSFIKELESVIQMRSNSEAIDNSYTNSLLVILFMSYQLWLCGRDRKYKIDRR